MKEKRSIMRAISFNEDILERLVELTEPNQSLSETVNHYLRKIIL